MTPDKDDPLFTPDPTKYNVGDISIKTPSWQIPKSKRLLGVVASKTPGSGKYEYKTYIGEGPKHIISPKTVLNENARKKLSKCASAYNLPGPGFYDPLDRTCGPKITIGQKHYPKQKSMKEIVPGVGSYDLRKDKSFEVPSVRFDREKRNNLNINNSILKNPGPNTYKYNLEGNSSSAPKWSFSRVERFPRCKSSKNIMPGPGKYAHKQYTGKEGPIYTFNKDKFSHSDAIEESIKNRTKNFPSPTTYLKSIKYMPDTPKYSITRSKRPDSIPRDSFPGPGSYKPDSENASYFSRLPIWTISKSNRDENEKVKDSKKVHIPTPGPGQYHVKNGMMPEGPSYTIITKKKAKKVAELPGPGAYNIKYENVRENIPVYSIGLEKRDDDLRRIIKENFPGPASYKINDSKAFQNILFSHAKKHVEKVFAVPGPGQYKIPTAFDYINNITREQGIFDPTFKYV